MIKPIELRLGNRIYKHFEDGPGEEIEVSVRDIFDAQRSIVEKSFKFSFTGIPLTEEWLLKFGFEKHARMVVFKNIKLSYWVKDAVCLFFNGSPPENTYLLGIGFNIGNDYYAATTIWIDKVHELQNAFFAFKGKELELTPSTV